MVSKRIQSMTPSATVELTGIIADLAAKGIPVVKLNVGEPDFDTPPAVVEACHKAMLDGQTKYIAVAGIMPLRKAICEKLERDNGVSYRPEDIVVATGAKQALYNAVMAICNPGDEIIIPTPCWVSYVEMVKLAEGIPVLVDTRKEDFGLDMDAVKKAITPKTRAILLNTPNNPTGAVYSEAELRELGELAVKNDFYIISDEVYEKLIYGGQKHVCVASLSQDIKAHCIVVNGMSKTYAMTGWRVGYSAAPADVTKGIVSLQGHTTTNATTFVQYGALEALKSCDGFVQELNKEFAKRREYVVGRLQAMPGVTCATPLGAFYLMPDVSSYYSKAFGGSPIKDSAGLSKYLLEEARIAVVPGAAFESPSHIRISYSNSMENLEKGMDAMAEALSKLC